MANLGDVFNVEDLPEGRGSFEVIPAGWYTATITSADLKDTKDRTGKYIALRLDILGPTHQGRVVFSNINIRNASTKAEEIGRQQLRDLMLAIGLSSVRDTDQLVGGNLEIKLKITKSEEYGDKNEVTAYKATGNTSAVPSSSSAKPAASAEKKGGGLPWAK